MFTTRPRSVKFEDLFECECENLGILMRKKKCYLNLKVPKLKKAALMISLVPDDVGKPTFKLEKAEVKEGICSWENPIYVSVKLIKEPKTGIIREKIYHFVVATVSEKSTIFMSSEFFC